MARIEIDPNYSSPTFSRATASTDLFKKEDVQALAAAISTHVHDGAGKGLSVAPGAATIPGSALTNGSVTLAKLAADSVDSSKIVDGTIATADLANASVTNAKLASDTARANLLTNGSFEIWQRGNGPFTLTGTYSADRWQLNFNGTATTCPVTATATTFLSGGSSAQCAYTHIAGGSFDLRQLLISASKDFVQLSGKTLTLNIGVKSSVIGTVRAMAFDGSGYVYGAFNTTTTGEALTLTFTAVPSAATVLVGINISVASCTVEVNDAMLVVGSVGATYAPLHPADDLARCLRYWRPIRALVGWSPNTTIFRTAIPLIPPMAVTPTVTITAVGTINDGASAYTQSSGGISASPTVDSLWLDMTNFTGLTAFRPAYLASGGGYLVLEANP